MGRVADLVKMLDKHRLTVPELHELASLLDSMMSNIGLTVPWAISGNQKYFRVAGETYDANSYNGAGYFQYSDNGKTLVTQIDNAGYIFNEQGGDIDFKIEGDNDPYLFYVDASTDSIGIGTNEPGSTKLLISATVNTTIGSGDDGTLFIFKNQGTGDNYFMNSVNNSAAGDPGILLLVQGVGGWLVGVDNSDSDKLKFSSSWDDLAAGAKVTFTTGGDVGIGTTTPGEKLDVNGTVKSSGGRIVNTTRKTTTYTALVTDHVIFCDTDGGDWTLTLPAGAEGQFFRIINCGGSGNTLTIDGDSAETVMGAATQLVGDGEIMILVYNATEGWW